MSLKTYDSGPWPSLIFEIGVSMTPFKQTTYVERIITTSLMYTKYFTTGYHVSGEKHTPQ